MEELDSMPMSEAERLRHQFQNLERHLRKELRRFNLSERQRIIADVILDTSYGWGLKCVKVPKLDFFTDLTGISRGNVHSALKALYEMRIVEAVQKDGIAEYCITPSPDRWQATPRQSRARITHAIELLKIYNGLAKGPAPELTPEGFENFKIGRNGEFSSRSVSNSGTDTETFPWSEPVIPLDS